jgi:hypothetical protein
MSVFTKIKLHLVVVLPVVFLILLAAGTALAQSTGSISGSVQDPTGASVAHAQVTVKNLATNAELKATASESGTFEFPAAALGTYSITVEAPGFKRAVVSGVVVNVSLIASVIVKLEIGAASESVTVVGESQQTINTVSAELKNVVDRRQILDLPLPGRNPIDLARLQAGVAVPSGTNARQASINGLRGNMTNLTQDGINVQDNVIRGDGLFSQASATVENTGEFSIAVGTINADSGSGAVQVKFVTPQGSNAFHGSLFEFHRNRALNANSFFNNQSGTPRPIQIQNRYGFNAGGPLYVPKLYDGRNRTFIFGAYENFDEPVQTTRNRTVWTQQARQGIFRHQVGSEVRSVNLLQVAPVFKTLNPITQALLGETPLPNNTDAGDGLNTAGYRFLAPARNNSDRITVRVDQHLTRKWGEHKLEVVMNRHLFLNDPDIFNNTDAPFPDGQNRFIDFRRVILSTAVHSTINSRTYNEFRFGFISAPVGFLRHDPDPRGFYFSIPIGQNPQNTGQDSTRNSPVYTFQDNFSYVWGTHAFKTGFEVRSTSAKETNDAGIVKTITLGTNPANPDGLLISMFPGLTNNTVFGNARSQYQTLVGLLNNAGQTFNVVDPRTDKAYTPGAGQYRFERYRELSLFFTDQWRYRPNLTLNLGLRYELVKPPDVLSGNALLPENGIASLFGISGLGNLFKPGTTPGTAVNNLVLGGSTNGRPFYNLDKNNFAPFLGFAYQPAFNAGLGKLLFGDKQSSFRGGYSVSYTREGFNQMTAVIGANQGLQQRITTAPLTGVLTSAGVTVPTPAFTLPRSDADLYTLTAGSGGFWTYDPNYRIPYVQQWSFGFERELPSRLAFEVRYVGNHAVKLPRAIDINEVNIFENGFLQEFLNAQRNLAINNGTTFAPGAAGTVALPTFSTLFAGLPATQGFASTAFINNLNTGTVGSLAFTLANNPTFQNNRRNLTPNFFLANPNLNFARITGNGASSSYNALQTEVRRRFSTGLFLQANYTFSKVLTDSETQGGGTDAYRTIRNVGLDRHRASFDVTHTFNANYLYDLPIGPGRRFLNTRLPVLKQALEGWQLSGLISWHTAPYKTILSGRGTYNQFSGDNTAVPIGDAVNKIKDAIGIYRTPQGIFWLNPNLLNVSVSTTTGLASGATLQSGLFTHPGPGQLGVLGPGVFKSPRFFQTDFSVLKRTKILEKTNLEFRAEFFNFFNNVNFSGAAADINFESTQFGRITGTFDARIIQLAMRFNW